MAGDWIKLEHTTPDKPEIDAIARILNISHEEAFARCVRVWIWADQHIENCNATNVTLSCIDRASGVTGFAEAMREVGWLRIKNDLITIANFDRHNGETAKRRSLTARRVSDSRKRKRNATNVTQALPEKRREESISASADIARATPRSRFVRPDVEEVAAYCRERSNAVSPQAFVAHYEANGWRVGRVPMRDWRAAVRTWEQREAEYGNRGGSSAGQPRKALTEEEAREKGIPL